MNEKATASFRASFIFILSGCCILLTGCGTLYSRLPPLPANAIRPVVAVTDFENESGFSGQWKLGRGIPDLLVAELLKTDRVVVVERKHLQSIVNELTRQGQNFFRKEDSVEQGRLKNARFLIRGVITDFTQTQSATGWFRSSNTEIGGSGARAVVMIHLTLTDVETGEILCSIPAEGTAKASSSWIRFDYNKTSFGGDLFFKSPVGKATQEAIQQAVFTIVQKLPYATWEARIADSSADMVIVNGGENVHMRVGDTFEVREERRPVTDPATGNVIDWFPGRTVGKVKINRVNPSSSEATILSGEAQRGHYLEKIQQPGGSQ